MFPLSVGLEKGISPEVLEISVVLPSDRTVVVLEGPPIYTSEPTNVQFR